MINLSLRISNPWAKDNFKNLWASSGSFTKNKHWESEIIQHAQDLFVISINLTVRGQDHAGLRMSFALLGYTISLDMYDGRHWDYENNCWEV